MVLCPVYTREEPSSASSPRFNLIINANNHTCEYNNRIGKPRDTHPPVISSISAPRLICDKDTEVPVMNLTLEKCQRGGPQPRTLSLTQVHFLLQVTHSPLLSGHSTCHLDLYLAALCFAFPRHFIWSLIDSQYISSRPKIQPP